MDSRRRKVVLAVASICLIWGGSFAVTRIGVRELPPFLFGGFRFTTAGILLLALSYALGNRPRFDRLELRHLFWVALGSVVLSNGANVWSLQWMASSHSALLNATAALWIAVLSAFGPRAHALDRRTLFGLLLGFAGTALILLGSGRSATGPDNRAWLPDVVVLVGVLGWSLATVYLRSFPSRLDIMSFTAGQMLIGGLIMTTIGLSAGELPRWHWTPAGVSAFLYMVLLSSIVAYTPYGWLAKNTTPAVVGSYSYVTPAIAALLGWWLLDEHLTGLQLLGMAAMLLGVFLSSWPQARAGSGTAPNEGHGA